jgi:hypothetical protein
MTKRTAAELDEAGSMVDHYKRGKRLKKLSKLLTTAQVGAYNCPPCPASHCYMGFLAMSSVSAPQSRSQTSGLGVSYTVTATIILTHD